MMQGHIIQVSRMHGANWELFALVIKSYFKDYLSAQKLYLLRAFKESGQDVGDDGQVSHYSCGQHLLGFKT